MSSFCSTSTSKPFSTGLLFIHSSSSLYSCIRIALTHIPLHTGLREVHIGVEPLEPVKFPLIGILPLQYAEYWIHSLVLFADLLSVNSTQCGKWVHSIPQSMSLRKMQIGLVPTPNSWGTPHIIDLSPDIKLLTTDL